ncbi:hypothetical protein GJAV_G00251010 [Gymnothorax javanicus]|nr:hypothetical protein GJAV_G00251010 [Gymnothorax javanicus]
MGVPGEVELFFTIKDSNFHIRSGEKNYPNIDLEKIRYDPIERSQAFCAYLAALCGPESHEEHVDSTQSMTVLI